MPNITTTTVCATIDGGQTFQPEPAGSPAGDLTPAPVDDAMAQTLDSALEHQMELNRHRTALLRLATDPDTAYTLYLLLTHETATSGDLTLSAGDDHPGRCIGCWVKRYTKRGLLEPDDEQALVTAMMQVARYTAGFPVPLTSDELHQLTCHPQAMVRAAYALARDMAA